MKHVSPGPSYGVGGSDNARQNEDISLCLLEMLQFVILTLMCKSVTMCFDKRFVFVNLL